MRLFLCVFLCVLICTSISHCESNAATLPKDECYKIDEVMHDPNMKNTEICKLSSNICTYVSPVKFKPSNEVVIMYYRPIPCSQFERFKKIACLK